MIPASPNPISPNNNNPNTVDFGLLKQVRWEQTGRELSRLADDFAAWIERRRDQDKNQPGNLNPASQKLIHKTRLDAIENVFNEAIEQIRSVFNHINLSPQRDSRQVYDDCRVIDFSLIWLGRVWDYYRLKFDQRDESESVARMLNAADELVWSCYKQIFLIAAKLPPGVTIGPAPLPFVAPQYSPSAYEHGKPTPEGLKSGGIALDKIVSNLPVPLLSLPPWCLHSPWWLVFTAHEVGHHILYELHFQDTFANNLGKKLIQANVPTDSVDRWKAWSQEIFADLFSLTMVGPAALRALVEIVLTLPAKMFTRQDKYPAPAVRLELMRRAANLLFKPVKKEQAPGVAWELLPKDQDGLAAPGDVALGSFDHLQGLPPGAAIQTDLNEIDNVLDYALGELDQPFHTLENLCNLGVVKSWLDDPNQGVANWSGQLLRRGQNKPADPPAALVTPRLIVASALDAWVRSTSLPGAQDRRDALDALSSNTVEVLLKSGPPGVRGEPLRMEQAAGKGLDLAEALLQAGRNQLDEMDRQGG